MSKAEIYNKLTEIFRDVFDNDEIEISDVSTAKDIDGWDSLTHIALLASVEDEFDIKFDMKVVQGLKDVGEMVSVIEKLSKY